MMATADRSRIWRHSSNPSASGSIRSSRTMSGSSVSSSCERACAVGRHDRVEAAHRQVGPDQVDDVRVVLDHAAPGSCAGHARAHGHAGSGRLAVHRLTGSARLPPASATFGRRSVGRVRPGPRCAGPRHRRALACRPWPRRGRPDPEARCRLAPARSSMLPAVRHHDPPGDRQPQARAGAGRCPRRFGSNGAVASSGGSPAPSSADADHHRRRARPGSRRDA